MYIRKEIITAIDKVKEVQGCKLCCIQKKNDPVLCV